MKKMKGVAASVEYSRYAMYEDQRARFKHQSLMQDFQDLHKETEAMRKKLQMLKERKSTLLAEVRFLKRRHKFLMQNRSSNAPAERFFAPPQNTMIRSKPNMKGKKSTGKEHSLRHKTTGFDLNQFTRPSPMFDLNQKQQKVFSEKEEVTLRSSLPALDLNKKERLYSEKEAAARSTALVFDLNQISTEEEELQANDNSMRIEELKKSSTRIGNDEQHNDIKLSACWNTGNGPNRVGKRKITWQDQVALRV
ncbi:INO80-BINDING PROTEIN 2B [Hibiscus trionum]|uniref:INO80-BINDING PROTEIN 2B n=1 Tax=Hibiscus trionum TaxID=183268 RepID=A0A9W7M5N7_HIBTR|nr:INO80-BINDING PROTEIN 2B [Hibiscus trionum]